MDLYQSTLDYIFGLSGIAVWPELQEILARMAALKPRDWQLPGRACQAFGGTAEQAIPAAGALACAQIAIILIDDMLDEDPRGEYRQLGAGETANIAAALLGAAGAALLQTEASAPRKLAAVQVLHRMLTAVALGQFLDVRNPADEAAYWRAVQMKSGSFFRAAFELGALFGGATADLTTKVGKLGLLYGEMIQIHDDLGDALTEPAGPDWLEGRHTLPILFAETVDHPDRQRFHELRSRIQDPSAFGEAQSILIGSGAVSYCLDQLMSRYQQANSLLSSLEVSQPGPLQDLLEAVIAPVQQILNLRGDRSGVALW